MKTENCKLFFFSLHFPLIKFQSNFWKNTPSIRSFLFCFFARNTYNKTKKGSEVITVLPARLTPETIEWVSRGVYTAFFLGGGKFLSVWIHFCTILDDTHFQFTFSIEKEWVSIQISARNMQQYTIFLYKYFPQILFEKVPVEFIFNWEPANHRWHCDFATGCLPRSCASISRSGRIFILFFEASILIRESTQPPAQWCQGSSCGEKRPVNVADDSPPSSSRLKNGWSYTSIPPYAFLAFTELVYFHVFYC